VFASVIETGEQNFIFNSSSFEQSSHILNDDQHSCVLVYRLVSISSNMDVGGE